MSEITLTNIPAMPVGKLVDRLSTAYSRLIGQKLPVKIMPSVMLWGAPGVGKSQAVRQIAGRGRNMNEDGRASPSAGRRKNLLSTQNAFWA